MGVNPQIILHHLVRPIQDPPLPSRVRALLPPSFPHHRLISSSPPPTFTTGAKPLNQPPTPQNSPSCNDPSRSDPPKVTFPPLTHTTTPANIPHMNTKEQLFVDVDALIDPSLYPSPLILSLSKGRAVPPNPPPRDQLPRQVDGHSASAHPRLKIAFVSTTKRNKPPPKRNTPSPSPTFSPPQRKRGPTLDPRLAVPQNQPQLTPYLAHTRIALP